MVKKLQAMWEYREKAAIGDAVKPGETVRALEAGKAPGKAMAWEAATGRRAKAQAAAREAKQAQAAVWSPLRVFFIIRHRRIRLA
ncbi:MAG: hypothetical protein ACFNUI_06555 [Negativicutes bacterium]